MYMKRTSSNQMGILKFRSREQQAEEAAQLAREASDIEIAELLRRLAGSLGSNAPPSNVIHIPQRRK
jgi:hypothetical protein